MQQNARLGSAPGKRRCLPCDHEKTATRPRPARLNSRQALAKLLAPAPARSTRIWIDDGFHPPSRRCSLSQRIRPRHVIKQVHAAAGELDALPHLVQRLLLLFPRRATVM
jgi:hypothetical protein